MFRRYSLILLLLLISAVYFCTAINRAIVDDGDALYAHIAQQMARSGEWVTPYVNGVRFLDKPPMIFWLMASSYRIFGYSEFAARFPSALAVLGIGLLLFYMGRRTGNHYAGFIAGAAWAFCIGTFLFTCMVFPDIVFVFFLTLSACAFLEWYLNKGNPLKPSLLFFASMAGAVLTKGLIGIVFPVAIISLFLIWMKDLRRLWHFHIFKGSLLFLVLALPWHVLAAQRNPGFLWYFFLNEQVFRFIGKRQPVDYESISLPIFWALVLLWLFPWSAFFPAIRHLLANSGPGQRSISCAVRLSISWIMVVFVFFSFSSRIEHYAMPIFPPLILLIGIVLTPKKVFDLGIDSRRERSVASGFAFLGILGGIVALLLVVAIVFLSGWSSGQALDNLGTARLHAYKYYFAPLFEMPPDIINGLKIPFLGTCAALAMGLLGSWWLNRRSLRMPAIIVLNLMIGMFCLFTFQSFGICEEMLSSKQFGSKLNQLYRPGDSVIVLGDFETANSINFYSPLNIQVYKGTAALLQWGMSYPDAPDIILSRDQLNERWKGQQRTFFLVPEDQLNTLGLQPACRIMRSGGRILLSNCDPGDPDCKLDCL